MNITVTTRNGETFTGFDGGFDGILPPRFHLRHLDESGTTFELDELAHITFDFTSEPEEEE